MGLALVAGRDFRQLHAKQLGVRSIVLQGITTERFTDVGDHDSERSQFWLANGPIVQALSLYLGGIILGAEVQHQVRIDLGLTGSFHGFTQLLVDVDGIEAQVHELVVVDAEDSGPLILVLEPPSFDDSLLGVEKIGVGYLLWMRRQILGAV